MKRILVAMASLAVALAASFGASAHPFKADPTPPANSTPRVESNAAAGAVLDSESDVEQKGQHEDADGDMDEPDANDADEASNANNSDDNDVDEENVDENDDEDDDDDDGDQDEEEDDDDDGDQDEDDDD